ncbi:MAG: aromatic amino acid hydroxylase [Bdellovibrio sp.]|nr:aromatic amino acid hydroxylase [Bdellovibrio sp.]
MMAKIPAYLRTYISDQDPSLYTAIDHASWRYILKISKAFFSKYAHQKYLRGLEETGISTDKIPLVSDMSRKLEKFGWRAVPVTGFIPSAVFMEFLSMGILPIACDMRKHEHLGYTPAPDIVHEAAGHAPIIADPEYAAYLREYGEVSRKAIYSDQDMNVYNAVRHLSDTKEDPESTERDIKAAEVRLENAILAQRDISEATLLMRMGWWTFEYGLIGDLKNPKIYGAGLLSSVSESYHCLGATVSKIPFSIECVHTGFDITRPQPQLFVAPDFQTLGRGLEELSETMAFRIGGLEGLRRAHKAGTVTTTQFDSGAQISGILSDIRVDTSGRPFYLKFRGPSQLSVYDHEIEGQGPKRHPEGFGTPIERVTEADLEKAKAIARDGKIQLRFSSGVQVEGKLIGKHLEKGELVLLTFKDCTVTCGKELLFQPEWGEYDMLCGTKVVSVFGGAADRAKYLDATGGFHQTPARQKSNLTPENEGLNALYSKIRQLREAGGWNSGSLHQLEEIFETLERKFPQDWLLRYELLELIETQKAPVENSAELCEKLRKSLTEISRTSSELKEIIQRGLELL